MGIIYLHTLDAHYFTLIFECTDIVLPEMKFLPMLAKCPGEKVVHHTGGMERGKFVIVWHSFFILVAL